ncbi:MAG: arsenosugar biosynthesis radical SAM (seleno)protein ArsS [Gammaproteobacteria bacterium]
MHKMLPLLKATDFPEIRRSRLEILQVNLGYKCNQACLHCHVNASPKRKELMDAKTIGLVLEFLERSTASTLDVTGGAPEMNPYFRKLVREARASGATVIDRCNLTILEEPGYEDLADFLARHQIAITASLPCYLEENVDTQRGEGVFGASIRALKRLNALGYGRAGGGLTLNLVYNPLGPSLPPSQTELEARYKRELRERYDIVFDNLLTLTNMPIARFGSTLVSKGQFDSYMSLLRSAHRQQNVGGVMCRSTVSVDYRGYVYDCDFNQMLGIPLNTGNKPRTHLSELLGHDLTDNPIMIADHCWGCTAGQGSSCGGALA